MEYHGTAVLGISAGTSHNFRSADLGCLVFGSKAQIIGIRYYVVTGTTGREAAAD